MDPIVLPANQPADRFYRGGSRISRFRGVEASGHRTPEDWVASTTSVRGHAELGQSRLPSGELLTEAIGRDPIAWLGRDHVDRFGVDTKLLVKLLDAGQRLPVHAHPDAAFAARHGLAEHGKAEAWYILTPGEVHIGLRRDIAPADLADLVDRQDVEGLLALLHRVPVTPHDTVYVPPGTLHAIGEGVLLAEVQEPEDLSILLEWKGFEIGGSVEGHLGVGFEAALRAVDTKELSEDALAGLVQRGERFGSVLPSSSREFFALERVRVIAETRCEPGFAVLVFHSGGMELAPENGRSRWVENGSTVVVPHDAGAFVLRGAGSVLIARPPRAA
jgi:mannose-6-phosphate isomerase